MKVPVVTPAVDQLYRVLLGDEQLTGYFQGVDLGRLKAHMVALLSQVLGDVSSGE